MKSIRFFVLSLLFLFLLPVLANAEVYWSEDAEGGLSNIFYDGGDFNIESTSDIANNGSESVNISIGASNAQGWSWLLLNLTDQQSVNMTIAINPNSGNGRKLGISDMDTCLNSGNNVRGLKFSSGNVFDYYADGAIGTHGATAWETYFLEFFFDTGTSTYKINVTRNGSVLATNQGRAGAETVSNLGCIFVKGESSMTYFMDDVLVENSSIIPPDVTPPNITLATYNVTSYLNGTVWREATSNVVRVRDPSFSMTFNISEVGNCSISLNQSNYTEMTSISEDTICATTESLGQTCTLPEAEELQGGNQSAYIGCIDLAGNEYQNSTSGALNISLDFVIKGRVLDILDNPIVNATVACMLQRTMVIIDNTTSDVNGNFTLNVQERGNYTVLGYNQTNSSLKPDIKSHVEVT